MKSKRFAKLTLAGITFLAPGAMADPVHAQVSVHVGIALPPPIVFAAPPQVIVLPGSNIYVAADLADDFYFVDGWWWRPWEGRWYRSQSYNSGWAYYSSVPSFYGSVHGDWRQRYRNRQWDGRPWNYERVSQSRVEQNWSSWKTSNHWKNQRSAPASGVSEQRAPQQQPKAQKAPHGGGKVQAPRSPVKAPAQRGPQRATSSPARQQHGEPARSGHGSKGQDQGQAGNGKSKGAGSSQHGGGNGRK